MDKGVFYLVYTVVKAFYCNMYDTENYLVTARDIHGPWSEPVALNNFGFDPSLFHDDDGRKYMVSMVTDHRVPKKYKWGRHHAIADAERPKTVSMRQILETRTDNRDRHERRKREE